MGGFVVNEGVVHRTPVANHKKVPSPNPSFFLVGVRLQLHNNEGMKPR